MFFHKSPGAAWTEDYCKILLDDLGDTKEIVANNLKELGIKGTSGKAEYCPIAVYLQQRLNCRLAVSSGQVYVLNSDGGKYTVTPRPVEEFIKDFDSRPFKYPELLMTRRQGAGEK